METNQRYQPISLPFGPIVLFGILLFLSLTGCKTTRKVETIQVQEKKEEVLFFSEMLDKSFQFQNLEARLDAEIVIPQSEKEFSSRVNLKILKDSLLQLSIQPILGIEVFRLTLSTDRVRMIDRLNKRYVDESYESLKGKTPVDFNFYNLQALFTNHLFLPGQQLIDPEEYNRFKLNQDGTSRAIQTKDQTGLLYTFLADGEEKLLSTDINDEKYALNWIYTNFRLAGTQPFPMLMNVQLQERGAVLAKLTFNFARIDTDKSVSIDPSVPSKYERVTVDQILKSLSNKKK